MDAVKWTSPIGCFKEKLKAIIYVYATIKFFPEYLLYRERVQEGRSTTQVKLLGFVGKNWMELPHFAAIGGNRRGFLAFQTQNFLWHLLSWLAKAQRTRSLERIEMFTLWFLAKTHKQNTFFMFQVALY